MSVRQRVGKRMRKYLVGGSTAFAVAVTLLMVLAPASAGLLKPAYKGTSSSPFSYSSWTGCTTLSPGASAWVPKTGNVTTSDSGVTKSCPGIDGPLNYSSTAYASNGITVGIPFKVATVGNHSIATKVFFSAAAAVAKAVGGCPKKNIAYHQPPSTSASAYCEDYNQVELSVSGTVIDLNNASWYSHNYSDAYAYNYSYWQNYTNCYNFGTPTCTNTTTGYGSTFSGGYNEVGLINLHGTSTVTLWTNGTKMVTGHVYLLEVTVSVYLDLYTYAYSLLAHWNGSSSASLNLATTGHRAVVTSVTFT